MSESHTYSDGEHTWAVPDLWEAAKGIEPVELLLSDVIDVDEFLDSHCWSDGPMSMREILEHGDRVAKADLSYPIILAPNGSIGDGYHRLVRALREGRKTILAVRLTSMPQPLPEQPDPHP